MISRQDGAKEARASTTKSTEITKDAGAGIPETWRTMLMKDEVLSLAREKPSGHVLRVLRVLRGEVFVRLCVLGPRREPRAAQADQVGSTQGTIWRL